MHIQTAAFQISAPNLASCPVSELSEFAFIGRSNVGKSSLLNYIAGKRELAKVSATPGHTQLINFFLMDKKWTLVDLPGYGYAKRQKSERAKFQDMVATYLSQRTNLSCVFVLIDSKLPPQTIDLEFVEWLSGCEVPYVLVFTKTDKPKPKEVLQNIALFQERMAAWCDHPPKVFTTSSEKREGRHELLDFIKVALADKNQPSQ